MPDVKRFAVAGGVVVLLLLLFWRAAASVSHSDSPTKAVTVPTPAGPSLAVAPSPSSALAQPSATTSRSAPTRIYAVSLPELTGLPGDARSGTTLELWVAWEPPVTKHPRIQRLATGVTLDRIAPPVVPEGSPAALLRIPRKEIPSVLYGDRYGALSAVITGG